MISLSISISTLISLFSFLLLLPPITIGFRIQHPVELSGRPLANYVNSKQSLFVAEHVEMTDEEMRFKVMDVEFVEPSGDVQVMDSGEIVPEPLPDFFDSRENWPECKSIKLIRNQATCGSCWAFGTAEIISDRICIQSNATQQPIISVEDTLACCTTCGNGCKGGYTIEALKWWNSQGVVTGGDYKGAGCKPYSFAPCTKSPCVESTTPSCSLACQSGFDTVYKKDKHFGTSAYRLKSDVATIQYEIYHNGPVTASYKVYEDFYQYKSGIYRYTGGKLVGGHAVKIIGWGSEDGTDYWIIANSWGPKFGESGFFRMIRGTNDCGIEGNIVAGMPKFGEFKDDDDSCSASSCSFLLCVLAVLTYFSMSS